MQDEIRAAQALLSVLDQHIKRLEAPNRDDIAPSNKQFFIYNKHIQNNGSLTEISVVNDQLNIEMDAPFVIQSLLVHVSRDRISVSPRTPCVPSIAITDLFSGRDLVFSSADSAVGGATSSNQRRQGDQFNNLNMSMFPGSVLGDYYAWFNLPAEYLMPRGSSLGFKTRFAAGASAQIDLGFMGYKIFTE